MSSGMHSMKTSVEVPDDLYRRAKAEAALRGRKLKDLVEEGLRLVLDGPRKTRRQPSLAGLMKRARGVVDSGTPDLASSGAKKAAQRGPVFITDRGRPAHVLLTIEDYRRLAGGNMSLAEALAQPGDFALD